MRLGVSANKAGLAVDLLDVAVSAPIVFLAINSPHQPETRSCPRTHRISIFWRGEGEGGLSLGGWHLRTKLN